MALNAASRGASAPMVGRGGRLRPPREPGFKVGRRETGHLPSDHAAHFFFAGGGGRELSRAGRITEHRRFRGAPASRRGGSWGGALGESDPICS